MTIKREKKLRILRKSRSHIEPVDMQIRLERSARKGWFLISEEWGMSHRHSLVQVVLEFRSRKEKGKKKFLLRCDSFRDHKQVP